MADKAVTEPGDAKEQWRELRKLAVIGHLAGSVAHDFNNSLSATLIHLGLLLRDPEMSEAQKQPLRAMEDELTSAANLTRQFSSFNRRILGSRIEAIELNSLVRNFEKMLRLVAQERIAIAILPTVGEVWIRGDAGLLEQMLIVLCLASRDAMARDGKLTFETTTATNTGEACLSATLASATLEIAPLSEDDLEFVKDLARQHHGQVELDIRETETRLHILFPSPGKAGREAITTEAADEIKGGPETILLVEDEKFLRQMSALCLRKLGYAVHEAGDGAEALESWEKHHDKIDLLLTDFSLPGAETGLDLAEKMKAEKPSLRIMISGGHSADLEECAAIAGGNFSQILKPYTGAMLAARVRRSLDESVPQAG